MRFKEHVGQILWLAVGVAVSVAVASGDPAAAAPRPTGEMTSFESIPSGLTKEVR